MDRTRRESTTEGEPSGRRLERRRLLSAVGAAGLATIAGCVGGNGDEEVIDADENDPEELVGHDHDDHGGHDHDHGSDEELLAAAEIPVFVPPSADADLSELRLVDYGAVADGLVTADAVLAATAGDANAGEELVAVLETVRDGFREVDDEDADDADADGTTPDVALFASLLETDDGWFRAEEPTLADDAAVARLRQARARGATRARQAGDADLADAIAAATIADAVDGCVLDAYADAGEFHDGNGTVDAGTMATGLGMTVDRVSGERYADGSSAAADAAATLARETTAALDHYWVDDVGAYDFAYWHPPVGSDGASYTPDQLGSVIGGQLAVAAVLATAGDETAAETTLERATTSLAGLLESDLLEPWGLPAGLEYTTDGVTATAETVDVVGCWTALDRLESGLATARELAPGLELEAAAAGVDAVGTTLLAGGLLEGYHLEDGHVVTELDYGDGTVTDGRASAVALGRLLSGAGRTLERTDDLGTSDRDAITDAYRRQYATLQETFLLESPPETN